MTEVHPSDLALARDGYHVTPDGLQLGADGLWYIKQEVQKALIFDAVLKTTAALAEELKLPVRSGDKLTSFYEIKIG